MPFSSGTFSLFTPGNPVVTGTTISSSWANSTLTDIASGLSTAVLKDGTQTITANIPMSGFKLTGLAVGTAVSDSARVSQVQNSTATFLTSTAGTNTVTATASPTPAAYVIGQQFTLVPANTNTGATTLNVSSLGAGAVQVNGAALVGAEFKQNVPVTVVVTAVTPVFEITGDGGFVNTNITRTANTVFAGPTTGAAAAPTFRALVPADLSMTPASNIISGDVNLNNTGTYFDGPSVAQGSTGTWLAIGSIVVGDTGVAANIDIKLWDGTNTASSGFVSTTVAGEFRQITLAGTFTSPPGNIRMSAKDASATTGIIKFNVSGNSKDGWIFVIRIA